MGNFTDQYFSIFALVVLFRETIEASIVVAVLLQFLNRSFPHLKKQVWWGLVTGVLLAIAFGVVFSILFYVTKQNLFSGQNQAIFKGCIAWFAGTLITILAFLMCRYKGWEDKIKRNLEAKAQKALERQQNGEEEDPAPTTRWGRVKHSTGKCCVATFTPVGRAACSCWTPIANASSACWASTTNGCRNAVHTVSRGRLCRPKSMEELSEGQEGAVDMELATSHGHGISIFMIIFTTVLREGIESVLFLAGVGNQQPSSLPLPGAVGIICGTLAGMFLYFTGRQVKDIRVFIIIMSIFLLLLAAGQFIQGAAYLIQGGMFGYQSVWIPLRPWYMQAVYDLSSCCTNPDNFWSLAHAIFGFTTQPSFIEVMVYYGYWVLVIAIAIYKYWKGSLFDADWKHNQMLAKEAKAREAEQAQLAAQLELQLIAAGDPADLPKKLALGGMGSEDLDGVRPGEGASSSCSETPPMGAGVGSGIELEPPGQQAPPAARSS